LLHFPFGTTSPTVGEAVEVVVGIVATGSISAGGVGLVALKAIGFWVALIVAGVGLARGVIDSETFGVSILMTVVTTLLAPILLVPAFRRGGPGTRYSEGDTAPEPAGDDEIGQHR
jgi:hypothetical protein